jgi:single-strand DNA-binding protein
MNKAIITGMVGKDPEIKILSSNDKVANFSIATNDRWKDKNGEKKESTEWHNIIAFGKLAELCEQYVNKGSKITVVGKIKTRSWDSDNGKRYITEIHISELEFISKAKETIDNAESNKPKIEPLGKSEPEPMDDLPF